MSGPHENITHGESEVGTGTHRALQGTLDLLILRTLVFGSNHGQGIARAIQQQAQDTLLVDHRSLYPALQRLEFYESQRVIWLDKVLRELHHAIRTLFRNPVFSVVIMPSRL